MLQRRVVGWLDFAGYAFRSIEADVDSLRLFRCLDLGDDRAQTLCADVQRCRKTPDRDDELSIVAAGCLRRGSVGLLFDARTLDRLSSVIANVSIDDDARLQFDVYRAAGLRSSGPREKSV